MLLTFSCDARPLGDVGKGWASSSRSQTDPPTSGWGVGAVRAAVIGRWFWVWAGVGSHEVLVSCYRFSDLWLRSRGQFAMIVIFLSLPIDLILT